MNILLIHPQNGIHHHSNGLYGKFLRYAPLTMPTLAALVPPELNARITVIDEMVEPVDMNSTPDLVALTAITSTAPRAYWLADHFRSKGATIVIGGVHATLMPDECAQHAQCVVRGYADTTWPQLLRDYSQGRLQPIYNPPAHLPPTDIATPGREFIRRSAYIAPNTVELGRGCSKSCDFCVSHPFHKGYHAKDPHRVLQEIRGLPGRMVTFLDPNMAGDRTLLLQFLADLRPLRRWWMGCATLEVADDPELLLAFQNSGCKGLLIGFESLSQKSLDAHGKGFARVDRFSEGIERIHRHGMLVQGTFVFGFDEDGPDVFERTAQFAIDNRIDLPQFTIFTPFPGTPAFRKLSEAGRILHHDWEKYNGQNCVFQPLGMSPAGLEKGTGQAWRHAYSHSNIAKRLLAPPWLLKPALAFSNLAFRHMHRSLHSLLLAACLWTALPTHAMSVSAIPFHVPDSGWQQISRQSHLGIERIPASKGKPAWIRGTIEDSIPIEVVAQVLLDTKSYTQWMPQLDTVRILKQQSADHYFLYHYYDLPWPVSDRDVVVEVDIKRDYGKGQFTATVRTASDSLQPQRSGVVRITHMTGQLILLRNSPDVTWGSYVETIDMGGDIPRWIQDFFSTRIPGIVLDRLVKACRKPSYIEAARTSDVKRILDSLDEGR